MSKGKLAGSPAEEMTHVFMGVIFFIVAMPWKYFFNNFIFFKKGIDNKNSQEV